MGFLLYLKTRTFGTRIRGKQLKIAAPPNINIGINNLQTFSYVILSKSLFRLSGIK